WPTRWRPSYSESCLCSRSMPPSTHSVMPALVAGIPIIWHGVPCPDGRDIGERSDVVLRTAMPGHDKTLLSSSPARRNPDQLLHLCVAQRAAKKLELDRVLHALGGAGDVVDLQALLGDELGQHAPDCALGQL